MPPEGQIKRFFPLDLLGIPATLLPPIESNIKLFGNQLAKGFVSP